MPPQHKKRRAPARGAARSPGAADVRHSAQEHRARKRFGQHFLCDQAIVERIVDAIDPRPAETLVEIGPGLAALTAPLLQRTGRLCVIELDRDLAQRLGQNPALDVIQADVLGVDFTALAGRLGAQGLRIVGNLPYNISTPILFHLLACADGVVDQHFMLQKEVVERMVAAPATAAFGRLSIMLQWRYAMENILHVPPQSFDPPPRVDSAVVRMVPYARPAEVDAALLQEIARVAFSQRRKLLRHTLGQWLQQRGYGGHFDVQRRAEEVPMQEYVALAQALFAPE